MRVQLAVGGATSGGRGGQGTGGYPYWDATEVDLKTYSWGYTSCKGYCSNTQYQERKNGVLYYELSERGYALRNCTDYVAWKLESLGISPALTRGRGNGKQWDDNRNGVTVTGSPEMGDAAVVNSGTYGHVAFVEQVKGDQVLISQYNAGDQGWGNYSWSWQPARNYDYVDFNGVGSPLISPSLATEKWKGWIVQYDGDHKAQKTAWFVSNDSKRYWIQDPATYYCIKGTGAPGPIALSSAILDQLPDQTNQKATCGGSGGGSPPPTTTSSPPPTTSSPPPTTSSPPPTTTAPPPTTSSVATTTAPTTTAAAGDRNPPTAPTGFAQIDNSQTAVRVAWNASTDDVGVAGYDLYVNGGLVATGATSSYVIGGLSCGNSYALGIDAYDAAGNHSAQATTTGTTQGCPPQLWNETAGPPSGSGTFTNYTNAGGYLGPRIAAYQTVQVSCKLTGFAVSDGDNWWYRIASSPWNNAYYAPADNFYNNGATSGSLSGTPFYDPAVPNC